MGRFVTNAQGQKVYVPSSLRDASNYFQSQGYAPAPIINPTSLSDLASPISGMGVVDDIEVEQPVIYDRENLQFENLMLTEEENEQMRQMERERRERERERERQLKESREYKNWDAAMDRWMASVKEYRSRLRQWEQEGGGRDTFVDLHGPEPQQQDFVPERPRVAQESRPIMQVQPRRPQDTAVGRVAEYNRAQEQAAERQRIQQATDDRVGKEREKHRQNQSRRNAILNSPEAREMVRKIQQGLADEEEFKANWVKDKTHAWDVSIEGDAYQQLTAEINQESITSRMAGDLSGKTKERGGLGGLMGGDPYPVADPETKNALLAELEAEHNQREAEKQARLARIGRDYTPRPFDPNSYETYTRLREKIKNRANTNVLRTGDAEDVERAANVHDNLFSDEGRKSPEDLSSMRQGTLNLLKDSISKTRGAGEYQKPFVDEFTRRILQQNDIVIDDPNVRDQLFNEAQVQLKQEEQQATQFIDGLINQARTVAANEKTAADVSIRDGMNLIGFRTTDQVQAPRTLRESRREYQQLEERSKEFLSNPNVSESIKNRVRMALRASGTRLQTSDIESNFELRVRDKVLALSDYWAQREKRTGKTLSYKDKLDDIRKNHSPMELYVDEKTQDFLYKHNYAAALKFIEGYTGETALHYLRFAGSSLARLATAPLGLGAAARIPGFETAAIGTSEFFDKADEGYRLHVKQTLGDKRRLRFLGLTPSEAESVVTSAYQSVLLGGFGLGVRGIGAGFGFIEAADQYPKALREGLTKGAALSYAFTQGVNEGLPAMLFPGTNKWAKHLTSSNALKGAAATALKATAPELKQIVADGAKIFVKDTLTELLTESYTTFTQLLTEGAFIHGDDEKSFWDNITNKGWEYTKPNLGESLKHTLITVLAQSVLLGGPSAIKTLVTKGFQSLKERRDLKEQELRLVTQMQEALRQVNQQMAPLVDFIRTSGSVSDRLAEVINRISPSGAAQLRKLREQGKQISRTTIEKLYGPEIAGRLTKLEQREAFADAILGQKQRVQQEVIDNSPVLQESPTKVVEVEDQQTGEKNVVTVNVEQGQTAQEAVDEQVRTATGEAPVVTAEPATESPSQRSEWDHYVNTGEVRPETIDRLVDKITSGQKLTQEEIAMREGAAEEIESRLNDFIRDPDSIMEEIKDLEDSIINPETTPAERIAFEKRKRVLEQALNKQLRDRKKKTPEAEAPAKTDPEVAKQKKRAARAFRDSDSKIQQAKEDNDPVALATAAHQLRERGKKFGDDSRVQEADELLAELEKQGYTVDDPIGRRFVDGWVEVEAIAWVEQEGIEHETVVEVRRPIVRGPDGRPVQKAQVVLASPAEAAPAETSTPTEATPAEKAKERLKKALDAKRKLGAAYNPKKEAAENIEILKALGEYLYETAKELGGSVKDAATQLYKDYNLKRGDDSVFDKQVSSAIRDVNKRIKQEPATPTEAAEGASVPADPSTFKVGPGATALGIDTSRPVFKPRTMTVEQQRELYKFSKKEENRKNRYAILDKYDEIMGTTPEEKLARRQQALVLWHESKASHWAGSKDEGTTVGTLNEDGTLDQRFNAQLGGSGRSAIKFGLETNQTSKNFGKAPPDVDILDQALRSDGVGESKQADVLAQFYPGANFGLDVISKMGKKNYIKGPLPTAEERAAAAKRAAEYREKRKREAAEKKEAAKKKAQPAPEKKSPPPVPPPLGPPPLQTPAEKQQQKADEAKKELGEAFRDMMGGMQAAPWSNKPNAERRQKFIENLANYLYEQAKATGLKVTELGREWYKKNSEKLKTGERQNLKKIVTEAATNATKRLRKDPSKKTTPTPEGEFSDEVYSIKNANVDADLEALNLPKPTPAEELSFQETLDEAVTATTDDADSLVSDLLDNPRAPSPWEDALLTVAYMRAKKNYDNAKKKLAELSGQGGDAETEAKKDLDAAHEKYEKVYMASRLTGRESGRSLAFRRMMIREDYSLVNMEYEARISNEGELSKKQKEEVAELHKRIEELQSQLNDVESRRNNNKAEEKFKAEDEKIRRQTRRRKPGKAKIVTDEARDAAIERIKKRRQTTLTSGVNPEDIYDATLIGINLLENGVNKFSAWSSQIVEIVGDTIKPHLKDMWNDARSQVARAFIDETSSTLAQAYKDGKPINYNRQARKIYKEFRATQDRDTALKNTHEVFNDAVEEDFTIEQVRDFVSGYGVFSELSKEELEVQVRNDVGVYQQLAKIEAMLRGEAPLKTGQERREASDEERRLLKEVERLKKLGGYTAVDPAKALQTALASIKTRLENQIRDLQAAIDTKTPINNETSTVELDAEAESLKKERDSLMAVYKEMFPPETKKLDDQDRLAAAIKRTEQRIEKLEDHIERGVPIDEPSTVEPNEELRKLQEKRDKLTQKYRQMAPVKEAAEERKLAAALKQTEKSIEDLRNALATGKAIPKSAQPLVNDALNKLRAERDQLREQYKKRFPSPRKRMTDQQKIEAAIKNTERSIEQLEQALKNKTPLERKQAGPTNKKLDALRKKRADLRTRYNKEIGAAQKLERDIKAAEQTIAEMENALRTGKPLPKRPKGKVDPVLAKIHERRDEVRRRYREKFPPTRTAAQRIAYAEKALERAIERNKKRIRDKDIGPVKGKKARSARLDALRAENEALLAELRALKPKLTQEQKDTRRKIAELKRRIKQRKQALASGEYKTEQRRSEANLNDPTLKKLKKEKDRLDAKFRAEFGPQMALDQEKARVKRRIADTRARIASGQFSTEKKSPQEKKDDDEMRQLRLEEMNAKREFNKLKAKYEWDNMRWLGKKPIMVVGQLYDAVRTMKASIDFSGFRQAAFASMVHPVMALKAGGKMFTGAWSEKKRLAIEDELQKDPFYAEAKQNGVAFTERDGDLSQREEEYMAQWISSGVKAKTKAGQAWQVATYPYAVSERAFSTLLNVMRLEYYKSITSGLPLNQAEKAKLARFVNSATGRGDTGALGPGGTKFLTKIIWAPKLLVSRWNILTGTHFFGTERGGTTLQTRKVIFMQYAMAMRSIGTLLMLAAASRWSDDEDEWTNFIDPRSSKFGTIKIGNTYVDPWGGMKQLTVFMARTLPAAPGIVGLPDILGRPAKRNWEGELVYLDEGVYGQNLMNTIGRFAQTKLNPTAGILVAAGQNYDMMGRPMTGGRMMYELITPLAPQEGLVAMKEEGIPTGAFLGLLGMMGASLMIDDEENLSSYEQILDMLGLDPLEGPKEKKEKTTRTEYKPE